ncbi:FADH(2)-oxidizing methylenetetrahydrofolate--tRNA-(uracil(54)-C(5))-methyltransferase TrmFO [Desulfofundulus thermocisternus]|jgi:methylenetetrahydrofolate--tRNA-(uracil-5-)-methyltransferase|uniref:FADH(2)-oxidizing methylenetetrahydrofolate--tRNA-(uracil(54)-C(5))- methyltransferase TrmFO n=1 Tax=Desulfofundulus thermocisternus TaxID=42471 RepID=UPI001A0C4818|nr:FADH(2)-oxidizing methylenetetrahydrofolate--tRNA-(uracil(54)-C(5))-methyltransferase TrmFO [Desulfofundulus thermocisternus]MBE3585018.1 FADH(2)-oxidizing methylenetetrahydrofolate--tRNA-(uracil(54)-C(5))-methyltransferase TrmFO [Thermoanaerobacter sp.]MCS5694575.1 FADH(2)-oxidizing methylenetetrahydrofolate--tRNA-(uracil(54)-C(5))-methyltransferase TrmFO [Desulfofundulus thermocisternus]
MVEAVTVIGAGLAGAEAAWQLARRGVPVILYEMRPHKFTPAHHTGFFAELVCSNSLRAAALENAVGLLKEEMRLLDSLIMACADRHRVPAGGALAVDREGFARAVTEALEGHPLVDVRREEVTALPGEGIVVLATGPLTSEAMSRSLQELTGEDYLYFYDAVAPIVTRESINFDKVFLSSRYNKGEGEYINCPMNKEEYERFQEALATAERASRKEFEKEVNFEGCLPIEVLARRGKDAMRYGPLKPVGLVDPRTGKQPYAVVQLRQDNAAGTLYNLVGFQTHLKWDEQKRVFRMIPGLEEAEFVRFGVMHRNTYVNAPVLLAPTFECKKRAGLFLAGQMTGVEGYVESAASGLMAGVNAARLYRGLRPVVFPRETAHGSLAHYITSADSKHFQPMNVNFGLFPPLEEHIRDRRRRNLALAGRALKTLERWKREEGI